MASSKKAAEARSTKISKKPRRRERKGLTFGFLMLVLAVLAGTGVFMVAMQQGAVSSDLRSRKIEQQIAAEKAMQKSMRLEIARLKSPGRVTRIAMDELGLIEPEAVIYLKYARDENGNVTCQSTMERTDREPPKGTEEDRAPAGEEPSGSLTLR